MILTAVFRRLRRQALFTCAVVLTLAMGLGATGSLFAVAWAILLRPLPYASPDDLVVVEALSTRTHTAAPVVSYPRFRAIQTQAEPLGVASAMARTTVRFSDGGTQRQADAARVGAEFFDVLGVTPLSGRTFRADDERTGGVAIVGHGFWVQALGTDPAIVGRRILLDGAPMTVVGVLPPSFQIDFRGHEPDVWITQLDTPGALTAGQIASGAGYLLIVGRLEPHATLAQLNDALKRVDATYAAQHPEFADTHAYSSVASDLTTNFIGDIRSPLVVLLGAVGIVLLIACFNAANLFVERAIGRRGDIAVRVALGASSRHLFRDSLVESCVLVSLAGIAGALLAVWLTPLLVRLAPPQIPRIHSVAFGWPAVLQTVICCAVTAVALAAVPLAQGSLGNVAAALVETTRTASRSPASRRVQDALVCLEIAAAMVLFAIALAMFQHLRYLQRIDLGFDPNDGLTSHLVLPQGAGVTDAERSAFLTRVVERIETIPGVASVGATSHLPVGGGDFGFYFFREGDVSLGVGRDPVISVRLVTPEYFRAIGIPIRHGRPFSSADRASSVPVAIVSEAMARHYWGGDAVGHRLANSRDRIVREIVGVAGDVRFGGPEADLREELYLPFEQRPWPDVSLVVRATGGGGVVAGAVRSTLRSPELGRLETDVVPLTRLIDQSIARPRFTTSLSNVFAALALVLAISGVYAVVALFVRERTRDIAMRVALGARSGQILVLVLRQSVKLAFVGIIAGIAVSFFAARIIDSLLPGTGWSLPTTIGGGVVVLLVVTLASYIPVRQALRLDAAQVLRA